jgi:site-specific recombinase XerD
MQTEDELRLTCHSTELMRCQDAELPVLIRDAGGAARFAFEEFLHGKIRNRFTRKAYLHAVRRFSEWCAGRQLDLVRISPADVGRYLDSMTVSTPTRKLHLAALRRFFDELVMRHVVVLNPALSVRTERHQAVEGKTPEISIAHDC